VGAGLKPALCRPQAGTHTASLKVSNPPNGATYLDGKRVSNERQQRQSEDPGVADQVFLECVAETLHRDGV
jgi:hypothetical protein